MFKNTSKVLLKPFLDSRSHSFPLVVCLQTWTSGLRSEEIFVTSRILFYEFMNSLSNYCDF